MGTTNGLRLAYWRMAFDGLATARTGHVKLAGCATGGSTKTRPIVTKFTAAICGHRNEVQMALATLFTKSMREVAPGDLVFSFADTKLPALGVAQSYCWEKSKAP